MKAFFKENRVLLALAVIGLIMACVVISGRMAVENKAKTYDLILDYQETFAMAEQSEHDIAWWLNEFKTMGFNKVGLAEENLLSIMESKTMPVSATMMNVVLDKADWKADYPSGFTKSLEDRGFDEFDVLVEARSPESYQFIADGLNKRYHEDQFLLYPEVDGGYIMLNGTAKSTLYTEKYKDLNSLGIGFNQQDRISGSKLMSISLGLLPEKVSQIEHAGMQLIPKTAGYSGWNDWKFAEAVLADYGRLKMVPDYALFSGEQTLGYDEGTSFITDYLNKNEITVGLIENTTQLQNIMQEGVGDIVKATDYRATRVFTVWGYIQNRYQYYGYSGTEEIENTLYRAVVERNIRIIYYKPIKEFKDNHVYITDPEIYRTLFTKVSARIAEHGFQQGEASVMGHREISTLLMMMMAMGVIAATVLLIKTILPIGRKIKIGLFILGAAGFVGIYSLKPDLTTLMLSFAASVIFACLAVTYVIKQSKDYADAGNRDEPLTRIIAKGILVLAGGVVISLLGGLMTAAPISTISHMLEIDIFRGVKAAQLLPLVFFPLAYLAYYGFGRLKTLSGKLEMGDLKDMMNSSIKVWMVVVGLVGIAGGAYYILRTGHDTLLIPSNLEMIMRNTLETDLIARPRTKEFLFAFPAIMLLVYTAIRQFKIWPILFGLASVIGLTSVVNTFMHIRTPLYLGFARTGYSLLFGIAIGILGILIFEGVYRLYKKHERQRSPHA